MSSKYILKEYYSRVKKDSRLSNFYMVVQETLLIIPMSLKIKFA